MQKQKKNGENASFPRSGTAYARCEPRHAYLRLWCEAMRSFSIYFPLFFALLLHSTERIPSKPRPPTVERPSAPVLCASRAHRLLYVCPVVVMCAGRVRRQPKSPALYTHKKGFMAYAPLSAGFDLPMREAALACACPTPSSRARHRNAAKTDARMLIIY